MNSEHSFHVWHLGDDGNTEWVAGEVKTYTPLDALKYVLRDCTKIGLYFVVDVKSNPNDGKNYGPTHFWMDQHKEISSINSIRVKYSLVAGKRDIEVETIEI